MGERKSERKYTQKEIEEMASKLGQEAQEAFERTERSKYYRPRGGGPGFLSRPPIIQRGKSKTP